MKKLTGFEFVSTLSQDLQDDIKGSLIAFFTAEGLDDEEMAEAVENGMDSRLNDLEEIIDLEEIGVQN